MKAERVMDVVAAGFVADALWRRRRVGRLPTLAPSQEPLAGTHHVVAVAGVELDEATRRAAVAYARREGLEVLDLVPRGLDSLRAMELARRLDPASYRKARLALGEGGGHALVVSAGVAGRAGLAWFSGLSAAEMDALTRRLKRYAPTATDVVVTSAIEPVDRTVRDRRVSLRRRWLSDLPTYLSGNIIGLGAFAAGVVLGRRWGVAADEPDPDLPRLREEFAADLADGVDRFYEPRRADCPWCGDVELRPLITSEDMQHHRPGVFNLDRCGSCGHVFQNPRLSDAGLTFPYKEFYDGNGGGEVERGFRLGAPHYRDRARMLGGHAVPRAWLDRGHLGFFTEMADGLAGAYDVVSMHHYLEHTVDPYAELDAAATVLPPGGHLLIEVPDPEWPVGRIAGRWWHCWFQPQHLQLIPVGNLIEAFAERGLDTVEVHRGRAHQPLDLTVIVMLRVHRLARRCIPATARASPTASLISSSTASGFADSARFTSPASAIMIDPGHRGVSSAWATPSTPRSRSRITSSCRSRDSASAPRGSLRATGRPSRTRRVTRVRSLSWTVSAWTGGSLPGRTFSALIRHPHQPRPSPPGRSNTPHLLCTPIRTPRGCRGRGYVTPIFWMIVQLKRLFRQIAFCL